MSTILIVDDHVLNRQFLLSLLGFGNHRLLEANDGAQGLLLAVAERPDMIITDIMMPKMDGYEFITRMRANHDLKAIPVMFYTSTYSMREANAIALACGVRWVLQKPSSPKVILAAVQEALDLPTLGSVMTVEAASTPGPGRFEVVDHHLARYLRDFDVDSDLIAQIGNGARNQAAASPPQVAQRLSQSLTDFQSVGLRLTALIDMGIDLASERDPQRLIEIGCRIARHIGVAKYAVLGILKPGGQGYAQFATRGLDPALQKQLAASAPPTGIFDSAMQLHRTHCLHALNGESVNAGFASCHPPLESLLAAPIASPGQVYGWLYLGNKLGADRFSEIDEEVLMAVATQIAVAYENVVLFERIRLSLAQLERESIERRKMAVQLQESETQFRQLAESINEVFFLIDAAHRLLYISPAYERIWSRTCASLYAAPRSWLASIHPEDRSRILKQERMRLEMPLGKRQGFDYRYRIVRPDGEVRFIHARGFPILNDAGEMYRIAGIAEDITAYTGAMGELRESEKRIHGIAANTPGMVFQCQLKSGLLSFTYASEGALPLLGLTQKEIQIDRNAVPSRFAEGDRLAFHNSLRASADAMQVLNWEGRTVPIGDEEKWINCRATPRFSDNGDVIWEGVMLDISESKRSEQALINSRGLLRDLSAHMESVREEERKRIAREVHDELGQALTVLRMDVSLLRLNFGGQNPQLMERIQSMKNKVDRTIHIMRHVTSTLRPVALDLGLIAGLEWLVEDFTRHSHIDCRLKISGCDDVMLDDGSSTALFRIVQESLTNVLKHAEASEIVVSIELDGRENFLLQIHDNGKGFITEGVRKAGAFGLVGMRERALMLRGAVDIKSAPGQGTLIKICVPLAPQ